MTVLFKICGCAIIGAICAMTLKGNAKSAATSVAVFSAIIILASALSRFSDAISTVKEIMNESGMNTYGAVMIKSLGIGIVVNTVGSICSDLGESSISAGVLLAGKIEILLISLPIITEMLSVIGELIL